MKKISTATAHAIRKVESQRLTIGLDLGDRSSWYCVLDETGEVLLEQKLSTIPKTMREVFGEMRRSRTSASADVADQHGAGTDQVLRRAAARLQLAKHETRESERAKSGTASGAGAVAGGNRIPQRADSRVQRTDRAPGAGKLSASG